MREVSWATAIPASTSVREAADRAWRHAVSLLGRATWSSGATTPAIGRCAPRASAPTRSPPPAAGSAVRRPAHGGWISDRDALRALRAQADATIRRLGHSMTGWYEWPNAEWSARCLRCGGRAWVSPRHLRAVTLRGEALTLACRAPVRP